MTPTEFFADRVANHAIHGSIASIRPVIGNIARYEDAECQAMSHRAGFVVGRLELAIKRADPVAIPTGANGLTKAANLLAQAQSELVDYDQQSHNTGGLERANELFDEVLSIAASFDKIASGKLSDAAALILSEARSQADGRLVELNQALETTHEKLEATERRATEVQEEIDRKAASFNSELHRFAQRYDEEEELRRKDSREVIESVEERLSEAALKYETDTSALVEKTTETFGLLIKDHSAKSDQTLVGLEADRTQSRKILGLTAEAGLIGGYQREANNKRLEARLWRVGALGVFLGMGFIAWTILVPAAKGEIALNWEGFASRSLLLAILGLTAAYAANEGRRASKIEERNRRQELQLASVGPFIEELDDAQRHEIKRGFVERNFRPDEPETQDEANTPGTTLQLATQLVRTLPDMLKAAKDAR